MMPFPVLETPRLLLREIVPQDAARVLAIFGDAGLMRHYGSEPLKDHAAAEELIARFDSWRALPAPGYRWGLALRDSPGTLLGTCGLFGVNANWRKCVVGYELARNAQGHGLMHEALQAVLAHGFGSMGLNRVEAQVHPENTPSVALLRRNGFREEGLFRELGRWGGKFHDMAGFALLAREWRDARGASGGD